MILITTIFFVGFAFELIHDLRFGRNGSYTQWCEIVFMPEHRGWSGNQPPEEWGNLTIALSPFYASGAQLTAALNAKSFGVSAYIIDASLSLDSIRGQYINLSIFWWGDVFSIYMGLLSPVNQYPGATQNRFCDVVSYIPGEVPPRI